ncbi:MAG: excinuclease ABC subunit UvrC [Bacteroidia bacterium]|nr:excinuclease ABC subunit UvrC [Bacteroidia bacterium]
MEAQEQSDILKRKLDTLPGSPGVYQFRNAEGTIIYVGKAKNLRTRVRSYFQERGGYDLKREVLVSKIADLELIVTDSEVEALLLENNLIKEHTPRYNIRLKDDKSYPYIVVTNEPYPRVFPTRRIIRDGSRYYGPYTDVRSMHLMLRTIRGIFPIRSCDYALDAEVIARRKVTVCLDYHIKKCQGPCEDFVSQAEYRAMIAQVEQLLKGKTRTLRHILEEEMHACAARLEFEKAADLRNRVQALQIWQDKQKVAAADFKDRDIVALARRDSDAVGVVFRVRDGNIVGKQHFTLTGAEVEEEEDILEHLLHRYYTATQDIPPEIVLPLPLDSEAALRSWLEDRAQMRVSFTVPKAGDKLKLLGMCTANATFLLDEILLQKMKSSNTLPKTLEALQRDLRLPAPPRRIECFDISHFQGDETVASMVCFLDGKARKSEYRKFSIRTVEGVDDFASMREVVRRRYERSLSEDTPLPDLIVIDGGKGQLSSAVEVLTELGLEHVPVIGLAKRLEEVFVPGESLPMNIAKTSPGLHLLQRVRDEAHRFAITYHRSKRDKSTLQTELEQIDGVGPKRATALLTAFGSVRSVQEASPEQLAEHVGWAAAKRIRVYFDGADADTTINGDDPGEDTSPASDQSEKDSE